MKLSLNWVKQFTDIDISVDDLVIKIGAQLGAVEEVIDLGAQYRGAVIARVVTCDDHPNADRLHVCTIDDGGITPDVKRDENGYVQVVCGAPNVRVGLLVVWLPPGVTVPASYNKDPFVLEARELRGVLSNGMLASSKELAIGDDHAGILEVDIDVEPGMLFADVYELNDYIIDIENKMFTHRPDCFGMLGVAREIAGIQHVPFTSPQWYKEALGRIKPAGTRLPLQVENELPQLVPRFCAIAMAGVKVKPSPVIMQTYLSRIGIRPINNIVDITNYLMALTGQPLHAYDYDKVVALDKGADSATIVVRKPKPSETIVLLNGKTITPREDAIMIATQTSLIGVGGVMGGGATEVDASTKSIILEAANFDMYSIRRTSMAHGLFTDAVTRFNKGQSPLQNDRIIEEAVVMAQSLSGATAASELIDQNTVTLRHDALVSVNDTFINQRLGLTLKPDEIKKLLENVEFRVDLDGETLVIVAPFWRTDIEIPEDIVEEVGRLYGYDSLPLDLPRRVITPADRNPLLETKQYIRQALRKAGANELLTYSFVHGNTLQKVGQDKTRAFQISNALSPDLQYYRLSLLPSLLEKVHANVKIGFNEFALFELGKTHDRKALDEMSLPIERDNLALVYAAQKSEKPGAAYFEALRFLTDLTNRSGLDVELFPVTEHVSQVDLPFEYSRSAAIHLVGGETPIGFIGEFSESARRALKLPEKTAGFELTIEPFVQQRSNQARRYVPLSRFPKIEQDICLKVSAASFYRDVYRFVAATITELKPPHTLADITPIDIYQRQDDQAHKQITLRLSIVSYERTLTDGEVAALLAKVADAAAGPLSAERV